MRTVLELVHDIYKIRTCKYNLSPENINWGKFKVCLQFHIKNVWAAAEGCRVRKNTTRTSKR